MYVLYTALQNRTTAVNGFFVRLACRVDFNQRYLSNDDTMQSGFSDVPPCFPSIVRIDTALKIAELFRNPDRSCS